jgi:hypothetical protein
MKARIFGALAAAAALVVFAAFAITATGSDTARIALADRTLVVTLDAKSNGEVDNKPKGPSIGDTWQGAGNVTENGARIGRVQLTTTLLDAKYESGFQTGMLLLTDGSIAYQGSGIGKPIPGVPFTVKTNIYVITGGSGAYAGAGGTLSVTGVKGSKNKTTGVIDFTN